MRGDEPSRHGRAADALIASYLRELLSDDGPRTDTARPPLPVVAGPEGEGAPLSVAAQLTDGPSVPAA